jgi:hydroxyacylglutathione hydrolase
MRNVSVLTVPAFSDNYLWLIHDGRYAVAVDPGDAGPIMAALDAHKLSLTAILLTHHHPDHVGGVEALLKHVGDPQFPVFGPRREDIAGVSAKLGEGDMVELAEPALRFEVLDVPGHTSGHIAYVEHSRGWLFCGDTLFGAGCGRLFEGTPEQMTASLAKLAALPPQTLVYCAHEYTIGNVRFALTAEPGNHATKERLAAEEGKRAQNLPTVPSNIGLERQTNPFLRCTEPEILRGLRAAGRIADDDPVAAFAALREWKNGFK